MKVMVNECCIGRKSIDDGYFSNENTKKIWSFYVLETPVIGLSARSKDLKAHGWNKPWNKNYYLNKQLKEKTTNIKLMSSTNTYNKMDETLEKVKLLEDFPSDLGYERIGIYNNKKNQFISTFYHIRNSLAHGRFDVIPISDEKDRVYIFEDAIKEKDKFKISARMILHEDTLISWINLIKGGEQLYHKNA